MRRASHIWIAILLFVCGACAQGQSHVAESEKNQKRRTVYLKINGTEESAAQLRTAFEKAAAENELLLTDDPHKANSSIHVTLKEKPAAEVTLYAYLISATMISSDGKPTTVYSCKSVSDGKGFSTITKKKGKTGLIQPNIDTKTTVFVEGPRDPKSASLVESVKKEIGEAGFQLTTAEKEAEISLTNIKLLKSTLHSKSQETKVETMISAPGGAGMSFTSPLTLYNSVEGRSDRKLRIVAPACKNYRVLRERMIKLPCPTCY